MKYDPRDGEYKLLLRSIFVKEEVVFCYAQWPEFSTFSNRNCVFHEPFVETTYGTNQSDQAKLWLGVPKSLLTYAKENEQKQRAFAVDQRKTPWNTLCFRRKIHPKRWVLMTYMFRNYIPRFKKILSFERRPVHGEFFFSILVGWNDGNGKLCPFDQSSCQSRQRSGLLELCIVQSCDSSDRTAYILDQTKENPVPYLVADIQKQNLLQPDFIVLTCNTAHYFLMTYKQRRRFRFCICHEKRQKSLSVKKQRVK